MNPATLLRLIKIAVYLSGLGVAIIFGVSIGYLLTPETKQEKEGGLFLVFLNGLFFLADLALLLFLHLVF